MAAMPMRLIEVQSMGQDLAQRTVCVKVRLGRLGNTRKVSNSQVEVDTDKSLLLISKHLLDSNELRTIANFDGEIRHSMVTFAAFFTIRACRSRPAFIFARWRCWSKWRASCENSRHGERI